MGHRPGSRIPMLPRPGRNGWVFTRNAGSTRAKLKSLSPRYGPTIFLNPRSPKRSAPRPVCSGPSVAPTPFWHSDPPTSTDVSRIIGRADALPDLNCSVAHPVALYSPKRHPGDRPSPMLSAVAPLPFWRRQFFRRRSGERNCRGLEVK